MFFRLMADSMAVQAKRGSEQPNSERRIACGPHCQGPGLPPEADHGRAVRDDGGADVVAQRTEGVDAHHGTQQESAGCPARADRSRASGAWPSSTVRDTCRTWSERLLPDFGLQKEQSALAGGLVHRRESKQSDAVEPSVRFQSRFSVFSRSRRNTAHGTEHGQALTQPAHASPVAGKRHSGLPLHRTALRPY